jgi:hypothetical protein
MNLNVIKISLLACFSTLLLMSCEEQDISNTKYLRSMEDTIFKTYPSVNRVSVEVKENEELIVTLGDQELYNAPADQQQKTASEIGNIAIHVFGRNRLEKGDVVFVANETSIEVKENEKKTYNMHLAHE